MSGIGQRRGKREIPLPGAAGTRKKSGSGKSRLVTWSQEVGTGEKRSDRVLLTHRCLVIARVAILRIVFGRFVKVDAFLGHAGGKTRNPPGKVIVVLRAIAGCVIQQIVVGADVAAPVRCIAGGMLVFAI